MTIIKNVFCLLALLPLIAAAQPAWLNDGLVAYYPFDGDAKDYSGNGNDGEVDGLTFGGIAPNSSNYADFDGIDSHVVVPHDSSLAVGSAIAISGWFKFKELGKRWP